MASPTAVLIFCEGQGGPSQIHVGLGGGNVWLAQRLPEDLCQMSVPTLDEHLATLFDDADLDPTGTIRTLPIVQSEGKRELVRPVDHDHLKAVLAVGCRTWRGAPKESRSTS